MYLHKPIPILFLTVVLNLGTTHSLSDIKAMKRKAMTLIEILVASVVFALIISGLVSVFVMAKGYSVHARARTTASQLGKFFLDPLHMDVDQEHWWTNCVGAGNCPPTTETIDGRPYGATYNVDDVVGTDLRRVTVNITWNED